MYSRNPLPRFWPCSVDGHDRSPRSARERVGSQIPRQYGAAPFPAFCSFHQSDAFPPRYWRQNVIGGLYLAKLVSSSPQLRPWFTRSLSSSCFLSEVSFVTSWLAFLPLLAARPSPFGGCRKVCDGECRLEWQGRGVGRCCEASCHTG
jgi:hypothetical protein